MVSRMQRGPEGAWDAGQNGGSAGQVSVSDIKEIPSEGNAFSDIVWSNNPIFN